MKNTAFLRNSGNTKCKKKALYHYYNLPPTYYHNYYYNTLPHARCAVPDRGSHQAEDPWGAAWQQAGKPYRGTGLNRE